MPYYYFDSTALVKRYSRERGSRIVNSLMTKREKTIIIGGLMEDRQDDAVTKVPILGDIPLLGGLFRRTEKTGRKSELVILLSPVILVGDRVQQTAAEVTERVESMKRGIPAWPLVPGR